MDEAWTVVPIEEMCLGIFDGPHATPQKTDVGPVFLGISTLDRGRLNLGEADHLSEEDFVRWTRRVTPQPNDIVFSYETRIGEAALIPEKLRCCLGRRMALMRPDSTRVNPRFLMYAFLGPEFQAVLRARTIHGSTVDRILLTVFGTFPIALPPISEQNRIAGILGVLDDHIELNRRTIGRLEALFTVLFRQRLVEPYPMRDGLALSPSSSRREPWAKGSIASIARFVNGKNFTARADGIGRPVIRIADLNTGALPATRSLAQADPDNVAQPNDILFAWSGSLGVYRWHREEALVNQHIFKVICAEFPSWFVYGQLAEALPFFKSLASHRATTMGHIKRGQLEEWVVAIPPPRVIEQVGKAIQPIYALIHVLERETAFLAQCRDQLIRRFTQRPKTRGT